MKTKSAIPVILLFAVTLATATFSTQAGKWYIGAALSSVDVDTINTSSTQSVQGLHIILILVVILIQVLI